MSSRIPGVYRLRPAERLRALQEAGAPVALVERLRSAHLSVEQADMMVENVIGTFSLPQAVAVNLLLNQQDILVPMVVEEPSVVAAVSNMARLLTSRLLYTYLNVH